MRKDPLTNLEFEPKRISQRFENPQNRIKYHNLAAKKLRHSVAYVNRPLHKNLKVMNELLEGKTEALFHKQFLFGKGFSFGVHTHYELYNGKTEKAVYQYIWMVIENEQIKIIKTQQ